MEYLLLEENYQKMHVLELDVSFVCSMPCICAVFSVCLTSHGKVCLNDDERNNSLQGTALVAT